MRQGEKTAAKINVRASKIAVLDVCAELEIGFVAFSPLGRGLLAGRAL